MTKALRHPGDEPIDQACDCTASRPGVLLRAVPKRIGMEGNASTAGQGSGAGIVHPVPHPREADPADAERSPGERLPRLAYRVDEVAAMLGISGKSVRRLIARGLLKPSKALRHLLITRQELDRFLKATAR